MLIDCAKASTPDISVVIPHYDDLTNLIQCLRMLEAQTLPRDRFEVIVADNNSQCGISRVLEMVGGRAVVISAEEQGAGPARNAGANAARAPALAFIDSDCRPKSDWLSNALSALREHTIIGGRVITEPELPDQITPVEAFEAVFAFRFDKYIRQKGFTGSGNMIVRRVVFEDVGGFRSAVSEDVEWSHRAKLKGYDIVYDPSIIVGHPARKTWAELVRKFDRLCRESYLLACDKPNGRLKWFLRSIAVLLSPAIHVMRVLTAPELPRLADRVAAARVLLKIRTYRFIEMNRLLFSRGHLCNRSNWEPH